MIGPLRSIRPPMFGGAFAAAVLCSIALSLYAIGVPYILQRIVLG